MTAACRLSEPGKIITAVAALMCLTTSAAAGGPSRKTVTAEQVVEGLKLFYAKTARPDGSFAPGIDPEYKGMSDSAYSDLAAVTYAVTIHKTFGWELPHEKKTIAFLLSRQKPTGEFVSVKGTVDPKSAEGKTYNTTQGLVALRALGVKPRFDPLPVFEEILKKDYKELPAYSTSFFPLAYLAYGKPIPPKADRAIRELMVQDETGYLNNHIAATFHASHYYRLVGDETPKAREMVRRILRDQKPDGSWLLHMPSRDRHATFDAVFTLLHEGGGSAESKAAIARAARWALSCRNDDGGFGHFPGSTSDADAVYFQVGTLVMVGFLKPADPLPKEPHLLSWGHLMPVTKKASGSEMFVFRAGGWVGGVAFSPDGTKLAGASADRRAYVWDLKSGKKLATFDGHEDGVTCVQFSPDGKLLATGSYDHSARIWDADSGKVKHELRGHDGVVMSIAFSPDGALLATASIDRIMWLWDTSTGRRRLRLEAHRSWVNSVAFSPDGTSQISGGSDGRVYIRDVKKRATVKVIEPTDAEVRCIAWSPDGRHIAAGVRYGRLLVWEVGTWAKKIDLKAHDSDIWSVAFTPDGKTLVTGNGDWNRPGPVKFWDVTTGKQTGTLTHTGEVLSVAVSRDGLVAAGAADGVIRVWRRSGTSAKAR